jgi:hypothetical protein
LQLLGCPRRDGIDDVDRAFANRGVQEPSLISPSSMRFPPTFN